MLLFVLNITVWDAHKVFSSVKTSCPSRERKLLDALSSNSAHKRQSYHIQVSRQTNDFHDFTRLAGRQWFNHAEMGWKA